MRSIRKSVTFLCLSLTLAGACPGVVRAQDSTASALKTVGLRTVDYQHFRPDATVTPSAQSTSGWSNYSTAKKTWIIVGIVVGAAVVVAAVSNHSGGVSSGGGGY